MFGLSGGLGFTVAIQGGGVAVRRGGSITSFRLSLDISIDVVDIWNTLLESFVSVLLGLACLLPGLSDLIWSDLKDTGDREPSCLLRLQDKSLVGEADIPDMSLVRLDTRAEVSD
jgi:hypothetical protein